MRQYAESKGLKAGDYKKLNLPFDNILNAQPAAIRERMVKDVENFVYKMLTDVLNATDTAPLAIDAILAAGSYDAGDNSGKIEKAEDWTREKIMKRAAGMESDKGPKGNFDD
jgi:hypothetical protein